MPQLRRLAIAAEDPAKLAAFYQEVFELDQIGQVEGAVFLSDGTFNLALLPAREGMETPEGNGIDISQKGWHV
jgi:Glyoxalase/Bleomycin resistance protein/Dioxygenase superfamily